MGKRPLPPLVDGYVGPDVKWRGLREVDFELLGYFPACHLVIEHYIDHFLAKFSRSEFGWADARLQFSQKNALIAKLPMFDPSWDFIGSIKHLNSLRNRFAHAIDSALGPTDLEPLRAVLKNHVDGKHVVPVDAHEVLGQYTNLVCAFLAGTLAGRQRVVGGAAPTNPEVI
jgi:hypothetical protein